MDQYNYVQNFWVPVENQYYILQHNGVNYIYYLVTEIPGVSNITQTEQLIPLNYSQSAQEVIQLGYHPVSEVKMGYYTVGEAQMGHNSMGQVEMGHYAVGEVEMGHHPVGEVQVQNCSCCQSQYLQQEYNYAEQDQYYNRAYQIVENNKRRATEAYEYRASQINEIDDHEEYQIYSELQIWLNKRNKARRKLSFD